MNESEAFVGEHLFATECVPCSSRSAYSYAKSLTDNFCEYTPPPPEPEEPAPSETDIAQDGIQESVQVQVEDSTIEQLEAGDEGDSEGAMDSLPLLIGAVGVGFCIILCCVCGLRLACAKRAGNRTRRDV